MQQQQQSEQLGRSTQPLKKQYIDIPILVEETPAYLHEKLINYDIPSKPSEMVKEFLLLLEKTVKNPQNQAFNLYCLYYNYYNKISQTYRQNHQQLPKPNVIEEEFEIEINMSAQALYLELIFHSRFDKQKDSENKEDFLWLVEESWENYASIFGHERTRIHFHPMIVWDLFESFLHQFCQYNFRLDNLPRGDINEEHFSIKHTKQMLKQMVENISKNEKQFNKNATTDEIFAYYALLSLATIQVYEGNYKVALGLLSGISLQKLLIYSKSFPALINLFLIVSYSHFMLEEYTKSARIAEMLLLFYQRNKKHLINVEWLMKRQYERIAVILCLSYIFLQEQPKSLMMEVFKSTTVKFRDGKDKERILDKYFKLKQNDHTTFSKLFNHCCLPVIGHNRTLQEHHRLVFGRFQKLESITVNSILQHYSQIDLGKMAQMLHISEAELKDQLNQNNEIKEGTNDWDRTIMNPLLSQKKIVNVEITSNNVVKIQEYQKLRETDTLEDEEWEQYRNEVKWLADKVEAL